MTIAKLEKINQMEIKHGDEGIVFIGTSGIFQYKTVTLGTITTLDYLGNGRWYNLYGCSEQDIHPDQLKKTSQLEKIVDQLFSSNKKKTHIIGFTDKETECYRYKGKIQ